MSIKTIFEKLERISGDYKKAIDELGVKYEKESRFDGQYNDEVKAKRYQERAAVYNSEIDKLAAAAVTAAEPEITKLRTALQEFVTSSSDPGTLNTLQALITSGASLTGAEIAAFEAKAGYAVLRLLEGLPNGNVQAPRLEIFEGDLTDLTGHFNRISAYRSNMADFNPERPYGQSGGVGSAIAETQLDRFPARLAEMRDRWSVMGDI